MASKYGDSEDALSLMRESKNAAAEELGRLDRHLNGANDELAQMRRQHGVAMNTAIEVHWPLSMHRLTD